VWDTKWKLQGLDASRKHILSATEGCLKRLQTDWVDLLLIHWPDHKTPAAETIGALEELKRAGKIREYGVSNYSVPMMEACEKSGHMAATQVGYHLFDRRVEAQILPYCTGHKIGFMAYGTLGFGLLTGAFTPTTTFPTNDWRSGGSAAGLPILAGEGFQCCLRVVERLKKLAQRYDKTIPQLAIAWVLATPGVSVALVGARNRSEITENIAAAEWHLDESLRGEIDRIFAEEQCPTYRDAEQLTIPLPLKR
jgi:aryl-alcohol dehydrogenase-like predicted oxidoreductase